MDDSAPPLGMIHSSLSIPLSGEVRDGEWTLHNISHIAMLSKSVRSGEV
jgi:hypothetical protein